MKWLETSTVPGCFDFGKEAEVALWLIWSGSELKTRYHIFASLPLLWMALSSKLTVYFHPNYDFSGGLVLAQRGRNLTLCVALSVESCGYVFSKRECWLDNGLLCFKMNQGSKSTEILAFLVKAEPWRSYPGWHIKKESKTLFHDTCWVPSTCKV